MPWLSFRTVAVAFLAALASALVLGAVVLLVRRDDNAPIQVLLSTPDGGAVTPGASGGAASNVSGAKLEVRVYVSGGVSNPGVYSLDQDARLGDAVAAAGGATGDAQLESVNLARRVRDEEHYRIPRIGETPPPDSTSVGGQPQGPAPFATGADAGLIDLNSASAELLETLPGIGKVLASLIISYRERNGPFSSVEEITNVPRIGPATYENIRHLVTVIKPR